MGGKGSGRKPYGKKVVKKAAPVTYALSETEKKRRKSAAMQKRRQEQKAIINAWKLEQGFCYDCGLQITVEMLPAIDCDHVNPADKEYSISDQAGSIPNHLLLPELNKCQARCRNCHAKRTAQEGHWYHSNKEQPKQSTQESLFDVG